MTDTVPANVTAKKVGKGVLRGGPPHPPVGDPDDAQAAKEGNQLQEGRLGQGAAVGLLLMTGCGQIGGSRGRVLLIGIDGSILFARGRDIPAGQKIVAVSIADVTPTILAWRGLPIADDMDGKRAGFLQTPVGRTIATFETKPVERLAVAPSGAETEMSEQLEALGYLEGE